MGKELDDLLEVHMYVAAGDSSLGRIAVELHVNMDGRMLAVPVGSYCTDAEGHERLVINKAELDDAQQRMTALIHSN